ncbi:MAG: DnaJ domain-containing protein [Fimbriimonadaceae bacterium]|nr:DnaJ domain-containing protein [Fimbriimonadaceae bacterium]
MAGRFYEVLGLTHKATPDEIRTAYRKLVKRYHPDHSPDANSTEIFLKVQEAYEVLSDPDRRAEYDRLQVAQEQLRKQRKAAGNQGSAKPPPKSNQERAATKASAKSQRAPNAQRQQSNAPPSQAPSLAAEVTRLSMLFAKGRLAEAETLAMQIISRDARVPLPYAVLGDVARQKGNFAEASKMYAYAAQFDPTNPVYIRKHEELMNRVSYEKYPKSSKKPDAVSPAPYVGFILVSASCVYVAVSREVAILPALTLINTWTLGLVVMLFISGVTVGASLSAGRLLDRFDSFTTNALGRVAPSLALAPIALVNFWAAVALYVLLGLGQKSFAYSISRVLASVSAVVLMATLSAVVSGRIEPMQVFLWGGNIAYFGALCGWMVADSLKSV